MRSALTILTEELRRLKAEGVKTVRISPDSVAALRRVVQAGKKEQPAAVAPAAVVSEPAARPASPVREAAAPVPVAPPEPKLPPPTPFILPAGTKDERMAALHAIVLNDPVCASHVRPGKKIVVGVGALDAKIMLVGEAPGAEEEVQGEPFVGPAGQLLTKMIQGMGLKREAVYIGNIMNWRPELPVGAGGVQYGNRAPTVEEMNYCLPYLRAQIAIVQPDVLVALGATAAHGLLGVGTFKTLGEVRGRWKDFDGKPLMVTYHPSYILREPTNKKKRMIWEDLLMVMERSGLPVSDRQRAYFLDK